MTKKRALLASMLSLACVAPIGAQTPSIAQPTYDIAATVDQSLADKFLTSVEYPFVLIDKTYPPFPKPTLTGAISDPPDDTNTYDYSEAEARALIIDAYNLVKSGDRTDTTPQELALAEDIVDLATDTVSNLRACIRAYEEAVQQGKGDEWEGPDIEELKQLLGKTTGSDAEYLADILKTVKFKGYLRWFQISLSNKPAVLLNGPTINVQTDGVRAGATGELWVRVKFYKCRRYCTKWEAYYKWYKLGSITVKDVKFKPVDVVVSVGVEGVIVTVRARFTKLRLDYWILRRIPLEGIGNKALANKVLWLYDASEYLKALPVLNTNWSIAAINLPNVTGKILIEIAVKQVK